MLRLCQKGIQYLTDVNYRFIFNHRHFGFYPEVTDEEYLKRFFLYRMGYELDLDHPKTFNEKLQWLKLHDRRSEYTMMVDKCAVKKWVSDRIGEQYVIPLLGVWKHFDEIDFDMFPDQFVLKTTHDSGGIVIVKDKERLDRKAAKKKLERRLRQNYYYPLREWPYKDVPPRIIAEKYMADDPNEDLKDYKLMCFDGKVKCSFVCSERFSKDGLKVTFFDTDWNRMPFERHYPSSKKEIKKPSNYDEMAELAERLSRGIPFVRVDFYDIAGQTFFGEMTFYPGSGFEEFAPSSWDRTLGDWITLPTKANGTAP